MKRFIWLGYRVLTNSKSALTFLHMFASVFNVLLGDFTVFRKGIEQIPKTILQVPPLYKKKNAYAQSLKHIKILHHSHKRIF